MKVGQLDRIRSRGYWRINFVERNEVSLRGWQYPYVPVKQDDQQGSLPSGEFFEAWIDWWNHIEYWRSYRSRQFLHYIALREDWFAESDWDKELAKKILPGRAIGTARTIWQITEIFEFLSRLGRNDVYPSGAIVSLTLENTEGRQLWVDDPQRMPFLDEKKTGAARIEIKRELLPSEFSVQGAEIARSVIVELFDHFDWTGISQENIRTQQEQLLSGRI